MFRITRKIPLICLLVALAGCGSSTVQQPTTSVNPTATPIPTPTPTPTPTGHQFTLVLVHMTLSPPSSGYQQVTIDIGVRNDASSPYTLNFPGDTQASLSIQEGHTYNTNLGFNGGTSYRPAIMNSDFGSHLDFALFPLPPSFTFCGINDFFWGPLVLEATAQIPQQTRPNSLIIEGFAPLDLTSAPAPHVCTPSVPSHAVQLPTDIAIGATGSNNSGMIHVKSTEKLSNLSTINTSGPATIVHAMVQNLDKLDPFTTNDLYIWAISQDGIVRDLIYATDSGCSGEPISYNIGPSQTAADKYCFRPGSSKIVMLIFQSDANTLYEIVNLQ